MMNLRNIMLHENTSPRRPHPRSCHFYNNQKRAKLSNTLVRDTHVELSYFPSSHKRKSVEQPGKPHYQITSGCFLSIFSLRATVGGFFYTIMLPGNDK